MKTKLIYMGLFLASLLISTELVLVLIPRHTEPSVQASIQQAKRADVRKDSAAAVPSVNELPVHDSVGVALADTIRRQRIDTEALRDSVNLLGVELAAERQKTASLTALATSDTTRPDTAKLKERKTMAKLVDAMDAQGAAKILRNMDDNEVKEILLSVKKRQAGKILGSLDPERAARIMR